MSPYAGLGFLKGEITMSVSKVHLEKKYAYMTHDVNVGNEVAQRKLLRDFHLTGTVIEIKI